MQLAGRYLALLLISVFTAASMSGCSLLSKSERENHVQAYIAEAGRQLSLGHDDQARSWYDRAIALDPHELTTYVSDDGSIIGSLSEHSDWPDEVAYLSKAVTDPKLKDSWQIWAALAQAQQYLGQDPEAKQSFQNELDALNTNGAKAGSILSSLDPDKLLLEKAAAEWGAGDQTQSRVDFLRCATRYPNDASDAKKSLAYFEAESQVDLPEANRLATQALSLAESEGDGDEGEGAVLDTLGWVEYRQGNYLDAERNVEQAIEDLPTLPDVHYHLAMIYQALKDTDAARIEISRAAVLSPSSIDIQRGEKLLGVTVAKA